MTKDSIKTFGGISVEIGKENQVVRTTIYDRNQEGFEISLDSLLNWLRTLISNEIKKIVFQAGGNLILPDWFINECNKLGIDIEVSNQPNPFLEGSPFNQTSRILEFATEYHLLKEDTTIGSPIPWLNIPNLYALGFLEAAFFNSCVATQASIIKAIALIRLFDNYPVHLVSRFIQQARKDNQAIFISDAIDQLEKLNSQNF